MIHTRAAFLAMLLLVWPDSARAETIEISPGADLVSEIASLSPGDELVLGGGTYTLDSRLGVTVAGTAEAPVVIRSANGEVAHITRDANQNVINVENSIYVGLIGLEISGGSHGIRIDHSSFIQVEDCTIHDTADVGLSANVSGSLYEGLIIRGNEISNTGGTGEGMYLGCNDNACTMYDSLIAENYVHHTDGADVSQGDGIEVKDGSYGNVIRDNVIHDTNYPCILVYGAAGNGRNVIERNVMFNCGDHGIQAAAEAVLRNNIILGAAANGIHSQNHQSAVPGNLDIVHNTVVVQNAAIRVNAPNADVLVANNALYSQSGAALQLAGDASYYTVSGNVGTGSTQGVTSGFDATGDTATDFVEVGGQNVYPAEGSSLIESGDPSYVASDDFNGTARDGRADVGAYRYDASGNPGWAITSGFKGTTPGGVVPGAGGAGSEPTRTGGAAGQAPSSGAAGDDSESAPANGEDGSCGCRTAGSSPRAVPLLVLLGTVGLGLCRRRRSRPAP